MHDRGPHRAPSACTSKVIGPTPFAAFRVSLNAGELSREWPSLRTVENRKWHPFRRAGPSYRRHFPWGGRASREPLHGGRLAERGRVGRSPSVGALFLLNSRVPSGEGHKADAHSTRESGHAQATSHHDRPDSPPVGRASAGCLRPRRRSKCVRHASHATSALEDALWRGSAPGCTSARRRSGRLASARM